MPTYVYKFVKTGETIEVEQSFADESLTEAVNPRTGRKMAVKKVFTPVGVTFKGSGFFKTDNRGKKSASETASSKKDGDSKSDTSTTDSKSSDSSSGSDSTSSGAKDSTSSDASKKSDSGSSKKSDGASSTKSASPTSS
jgi:predicted nucleic acid-binding Zn ribbon protein